MFNTNFVDYERALALYPSADFLVRLEFQGWNTKRKCMSDCWWTVENRGGKLLCNWGKRGTSGRSRPLEYSLKQMSDKIKAKLKSGYVYDQRTKHGRPPQNPLSHLPQPFCDIRSVTEDSSGDWWATDKNGDLITLLTATSASEIQVLLSL
jgi:predicted DNA-binding WGR domain protein